MDIAGAAGTVTNASTISGTTDAVELAAGYANRLVLDPGAKFNGTVTGGNALGATAVSILELASGATAGTLTGLGTKYIDFAQIIIDPGASWTLPAVPAGYTVTILGTLTNTGTLTTPVTITAGGYFQNASGGTIVGSGVDAIRAGAGATVVNAGLIDPANYGVYLPSGGTTTNVSSGTIVGTVAGVKIAGGTGTVVNAGSIFGTGTGSSGVDLLSGGTVLDSGTISGVSDAVHFYAGSAGLLAIDPGAVLSGTVDGGNTIGAAAVSTLELASGASTGTVSSFGAKYIDFAQISVDAGARWILNDSTSLAAGTTLTDSGTVTVAGTATPSEIAFAGTAALVKLDCSAVLYRQRRRLWPGRHARHRPGARSARSSTSTTGSRFVARAHGPEQYRRDAVFRPVRRFRRQSGGRLDRHVHPRHADLRRRRRRPVRAGHRGRRHPAGGAAAIHLELDRDRSQQPERPE